ncbi:MAG TPA: acetyl-CoA carboxylase biotin carboxyl carrier protein [Thermoanaerobaculia bacterium]|nr:acetyl-CoA carboxylase biotin carboxyl carrier protein [Thermoanaerobaculia bacterium]
MKHSEILELIDKVAEHGIHSVEIEQAGTRVKIEGKSSTPAQHIHVGEMKSEGAPLAAASVAPPSEAARSEEKAKKAEESDAGLHIITSPIVGTFYRAASPESPPFVNVGDRISKGKVLCIVEAMKLMNEIESDIDGVIAKIYPQNGQPVEYGENLFAVKV